MAITVRCVMEGTAGNRETGSISDNLIPNEHIARVRGRSFLLDPEQGGYYKTYSLRVTSNHISDNIRPGKWVTVTSSVLGISNTLFKVIQQRVIMQTDYVGSEFLLERYASP